jgi:hypothetical protein
VKISHLQRGRGVAHSLYRLDSGVHRQQVASTCVHALPPPPHTHDGESNQWRVTVVRLGYAPEFLTPNHRRTHPPTHLHALRRRE